MPLFFFFCSFPSILCNKAVWVQGWPGFSGPAWVNPTYISFHHGFLWKWGHTHHVIIMLISSGWNVCDLYLMTFVYFLCNMLSSFISEVSLSFVCVSGTLCNGICHCGNFEIPLGIKDREDTYYFTLVCVLKKSSTHRWEGGKSF